MLWLKKNKNLVVLGVMSALIVGCAANGGFDWGKLKTFGKTLLHAVALNYTGPSMASIDTLVAAFTGQQVLRPDQQLYPGQYGYSDPYGQTQYPNTQDPYGQDPYSQYPGQQYPESEYPQYQETQYPQSQDQYTQYPDQASNQPGYPQQGWESWGEAYPDPSRRAVVPRNALTIDFALLRAVGNQYVMMPDGAVLRDGVGRSEPGDRFGIVFQTQEQAYVYIVSIDATGWAQTLFPYPDIPGFNNPVAPGQPILLPNEQLYGLDDARGTENIFVLVSRTPNRALEQALAPLRGMERSESVSARGATERVTMPMVGQRGLTGIVPGASRTENVELDRFFTAPNAGELAFSRWFVHE